MADETISFTGFSIFRTEKSGSIWQFRSIRSGNKIRKSLKTDDQEKAEALAHREFARILDLEGSPVPAEVVKEAAKALTPRAAVAEIAVEFLATLKKTAADEHGEGYYEGHENHVNKYLVHLFEYVDEIDFSIDYTSDDKGRCVAFLDKLRPLSKDQGGPLKWTTMRKVAITIRMFTAFCMKAKILTPAPLPPLKQCLPKNIGKLVAKQQAPRRAFTEAERDALLAALEEYDPHGNQATLPPGTAFRFYVVGFWSLMRRGEIQALSPRWIDFERKLITIPATDAKSGEVETIPMHAKVEAAILAEIEARGTKDRADFLDLLIFGTIDVRKAFKWAMKTARVNGKPIDPHGIVACHSTRHPGATIAASRTKDLLAVQKLGRWRSSRMVDRYAHGSVERAREVLDSF